MDLIESLHDKMNKLNQYKEKNVLFDFDSDTILQQIKNTTTYQELLTIDGELINKINQMEIEKSVKKNMIEILDSVIIYLQNSQHGFKALFKSIDKQNKKLSEIQKYRLYLEELYTVKELDNLYVPICNVLEINTNRFFNGEKSKNSKSLLMYVRALIPHEVQQFPIKSKM